MSTDVAMQEFLDSLSQVPGSLLYRDDLLWIALPPGSNGQVFGITSALKPGWIDPPNYIPALMQYNGSTGYYLKSPLTLSGNNWTLVMRIRTSTITTEKRIVHVDNGLRILLHASVFSGGKLQLFGVTSGAVIYLRVQSKLRVDDDNVHTIFASYTGSTGALTFIMDGLPADDTTYGSRIKTAGTLPTGTTSKINVGRSSDNTRFWPGKIGYIGFKQASGLSYLNFMDALGNPKPLNETTWTEWNGQPALWHESGKLNENKGFHGAYTQGGTVTIAPTVSWN